MKCVNELSYLKKELVKVWGITDYVEDIGIQLKQRENNRYPLLNYSADTFQSRTNLVGWLNNICSKREMDRNCIHLAVYMLDIFRDAYPTYPAQNLQLAALVCLLIAAKYDERDIKIPKIAELKLYAEKNFTVADFHDMEITVLKLFDWNVAHVTASHFIEFYFLFMINAEDCKCPSKVDCERELTKEAGQCISFFSDLIILDIKLMHYQPSLLAAAVIAAVRTMLKLQPVWTTQLMKITEFQIVDFYHVLCYLIRKKNLLLNISPSTNSEHVTTKRKLESAGESNDSKRSKS